MVAIVPASMQRPVKTDIGQLEKRSPEGTTIDRENQEVDTSAVDVKTLEASQKPGPTGKASYRKWHHRSEVIRKGNASQASAIAAAYEIKDANPHNDKDRSDHAAAWNKLATEFL
jgi:hypothetical protein